MPNREMPRRIIQDNAQKSEPQIENKDGNALHRDVAKGLAVKVIFLWNLECSSQSR
jgi:hypothetical protein